jgi:hypothetical protein
MDLETEALLGRHVKALLRKRAYNFQRDKKAWCCTTILPVLFVTMGFMLSHFAAPERNLNPITLDLSDLNPGSTGIPQFNPIPVNSPDNPYVCQPGVCSYEALVVVDDTKETYSFCGSQGHLSGDGEVWNASIPFCSIANSTRIMRLIDGLHGASVVEANVSSVLEVRHHANVENVVETSDDLRLVSLLLQSSRSLFETASNYKSSQYGAIWFTREPESLLVSNSSSNVSFATAIDFVCQRALDKGVLNYTSGESCNSLRDGYG